jgi:hypothetical protein
VSWINAVLAPILGLLQFIAREYENWRQRKAAEDAIVRKQLEGYQELVAKDAALDRARSGAADSRSVYDRMRERARDTD